MMKSDRSCPKCKELYPLYNEAKTVILVEGVGRELVHKFKYEGAGYLLQDFFTPFKNCLGLKEYIDTAPPRESMLQSHEDFVANLSAEPLPRDALQLPPLDSLDLHSALLAAQKALVDYQDAQGHSCRVGLLLVMASCAG